MHSGETPIEPMGRELRAATRPSRERPVPSVEGHHLLHRIGRGSYGDVWLARSSLGAWRAVKAIFRDSFEQAKPFDRELAGIRQFEPISRSHEGFVDILHVGINEPEGYFFYIMELGDDATSGQTIDPNNYSPKTLATEIQKYKRLPIPDCLEMGLALSLALGELHKNGLVHRDIKPANIIFVNGVPKLADIGLVALIGDAQSYVGTEGFIPPEGPGYPRSDVYSLGKVLYEASTGKDRQEFPALPNSIREFADREQFLELNEVLLDACNPDARQRYASATEMHQRLLMVANGKSVKRLKLLERRFSAFKRIAAISVGILLVGILAGYNIYRSAREKAGTRSREIGENNAYGNRSLDSGDLIAALPYFSAALRLEEGNGVAVRMERMRIGSIISRCPKLVGVWSAQKELVFAEFSPDGSKVLIAPYPGPALLYDLTAVDHKPVAVGSSKWLTSACFSRDGHYILISSEDKKASMWGATDGHLITAFVHPDQIQSARFSPDSLQIITASVDGIARVWNIKTHQIELKLDQGKKLWFADFSPDGKWIVTCGEDRTARIWTSDGKLTATLKHPGWVYDAAFNPECDKVVTACSDHKARVWTLSGQPILPLLEHNDMVRSAEFSPDGRTIITACADGNVRLWDLKSQSLLKENSTLRQGERATHAAFSPDGREIVTIGYDGGIRVWDWASTRRPPADAGVTYGPHGYGRLLQKNSAWELIDDQGASLFKIPSTNVASSHPFIFSQNGKFLAVTQTDSRRSTCLAHFYDGHSGHEVASPISLANSHTSLRLDDCCRRAVTFNQFSFQLFNLSTGNLLKENLINGSQIENVCFSPAGQTFAVQSADQVLFYSTEDGRQLGKSLSLEAPICNAQFDSSGRLIVICSKDNQWTKCAAQVFDVQTGEPIGPRLLHNDGVTKACFSPDNSLVATASEDYTAMVWNYRTGEPIGRACHHDGIVTDIAFNGDGRVLITASADGATRLWKATTGDPLTPVLKDLLPLQEAILNSNETRIYTESTSNQWRVWELASATNSTDDLIAAADLMVGRMTGASGDDRKPAGATNQLWRHLRNTMTLFQKATPQEIVTWHRSQAEECALDGNPFAAKFHAQWLSPNVPSSKADVGTSAKK